MYSPDSFAPVDPRPFCSRRALEIGCDAHEPIFDAFASVAAAACEAPIGHVILGDSHRQLFIGSTGIPDLRSQAMPCVFSTHLIATGRPLVVPDASQDRRFADDLLVAGPLDIRFFAGVPIRGHGQTLGSLCVVDRVPRRLDRHQFDALRWLADVVTDGLGSRDAVFQAIEAAPRGSEGAQHIDALLRDALREVARVEGVPAPVEHRRRRVTEAPYDLPDPNCLALNEAADLLLWADDLSLSVERLQEIVARVGPMRGAVRAFVRAQRRAAVRVGGDPDDDRDDD